MRTLWLGLFFGFLSTANAIELTKASNADLMAEIGKRLGSTTPTAASYVCDAGGSLYIHLTSAAGKTDSRYYTTGSRERCVMQSATLNRMKASIGVLTIAAVCDSSGYLYRVTLLADGKIGDAPYTNIGAYDRCVEQAKSLNGE